LADGSRCVGEVGQSLVNLPKRPEGVLIKNGQLLGILEAYGVDKAKRTKKNHTRGQKKGPYPQGKGKEDQQNIGSGGKVSQGLSYPLVKELKCCKNACGEVFFVHKGRGSGKEGKKVKDHGKKKGRPVLIS